MLPLCAFSQDLSVRLVNIRYYDGGCNAENPVLVKVNFSTDYENPQDLNMVLSYSANVTYTVKVKDYDCDGNIYYEFCSSFGEVNSFRIYFRDRTGNRSKVFDICAIPEPMKIQRN